MEEASKIEAGLTLKVGDIDVEWWEWWNAFDYKQIESDVNDHIKPCKM